MILSIITEFCNEYRAILDGDSAELSTTELNGGARISFVFHEIFASAITSMDPFDQIKDVDIRTLLYNSSVMTLCNMPVLSPVHIASACIGVDAVALCHRAWLSNVDQIPN